MLLQLSNGEAVSTNAAAESRSSECLSLNTRGFVIGAFAHCTSLLSCREMNYLCCTIIGNKKALSLTHTQRPCCILVKDLSLA